MTAAAWGRQTLKKPRSTPSPPPTTTTGSPPTSVVTYCPLPRPCPPPPAMPPSPPKPRRPPVVRRPGVLVPGGGDGEGPAQGRIRVITADDLGQRGVHGILRLVPGRR